MKFKDWKCPVCGREMRRDERSLRCAAGHVYDIARQGYVNFARPAQSRSGDNAAMTTARKTFLEKGYYGFLCRAIAEILDARLPNTAAILDNGCGVGYYLRALAELRPNDTRVGVDLSKEAIRIAAAADKDGAYCVANADALPCADGCFDAAICVFAPFDGREITRVLRANGMLLTVGPGRNHLIELKRALYGDRAYPNEKSPDTRGMRLVEETVVRERTAVSAEDLRALLMMTPYFYRTRREDAARLGTLHLDLTLDFRLRLLRP